MQNRLLERPEKQSLVSGSRFVRLLLILVPLVLLLALIPWPGSVKQAHAVSISCPASIQYGSDNLTVGLLQATLNLIDPNIFKLSVDDQFGPNTEAAVKTFQKDANIHVDGQVGPQTWSELGQCKSSGGISGGGCNLVSGLEACISWKGGDAIPDGYVRTSTIDSVVILYGMAYSSVVYICGDSGAYAPTNGQHIISTQCGFLVDSSDYGYVSYLESYSGNTPILAVSPVQWAS